jgi:hypothetical protein
MENKILRIREKYPNRFPFQVHYGEKHYKYLIPGEYLLCEFFVIMRKIIKLSENEGLFCFCNNSLLSVNESMESIYKIHHVDYVCHLYIKKENTFG